MASDVFTGLDRIQHERFAVLGGERVGLLVHPASVDRRLVHTSRILHEAPEVDLRALFGPQHGILGQTQDNMVEWEGFTDPVTGLPVHSLYGANRKPTPEMLGEIDVLVVDLQDVGARYYTFIWTLLLVMEACAEAGKRVVVLDRPNPIGGLDREGTVLDPAYRSFVGLAPLPMRHGLTVGELATWFRARFAPALELEVVWMKGWRRSTWFPETGLPWVMPSPNMPTVDTAAVYPGFCLLEGTTLSEGRGTTRPFEIFGAPFIDPEPLVRRLAELDLPGVIFRPVSFEPTFQKHAGRLCRGAQVHVTDRERFRSVLAAAAVLGAVHDLWPADFRWKQPPYEYEHEKLPIDILTGGAGFRTDIEAGRTPSEMAASWRPGLAAFDREIAGFLHYA
jgi:uncharacterized protein YbbC (DUF1343 family)